MILYTPLSIEEVLAGYDKQPEYLELTYMGRQVVVEPKSQNRARIVRIMSTEPADYLSPAFQPGTEIIFSPACQDNTSGAGTYI